MARITWIVCSFIGVGVVVPLLQYLPRSTQPIVQESPAAPTPSDVVSPKDTAKAQTPGKVDESETSVGTLPVQIAQAGFQCQDGPAPPPSPPPAQKPSMKTAHEKLDALEQKNREKEKAAAAAEKDPLAPQGPPENPLPPAVSSGDPTPPSFPVPAEGPQGSRVLQPAVAPIPPPSPALKPEVKPPWQGGSWVAPTPPPSPALKPPAPPMPAGTSLYDPPPSLLGSSPLTPPRMPPPPASDPPPAKPLSSPWSFHLEIVDGKNVITAKVNKTVQFRVLCDKVDIQSPGGSIQAQGNVLITCQGLEANGERMTIQLQDEFLVLEGKARIKHQTDNKVMELRSERFSLRLSELQAHGAATSALTPPPIVNVSRTVPRK